MYVSCRISSRLLSIRKNQFVPRVYRQTPFSDVALPKPANGRHHPLPISPLSLTSPVSVAGTVNCSRSTRHETIAANMSCRTLALGNHTATGRNHQTGADALLADGKSGGGHNGGVANLFVLVSHVVDELSGYG
jgi:hypothetical protein